MHLFILKFRFFFESYYNLTITVDPNFYNINIREAEKQSASFCFTFVPYKHICKGLAPFKV